MTATTFTMDLRDYPSDNLTLQKQIGSVYIGRLALRGHDPRYCQVSDPFVVIPGSDRSRMGRTIYNKLKVGQNGESVILPMRDSTRAYKIEFSLAANEIEPVDFNPVVIQIGWSALLEFFVPCGIESKKIKYGLLSSLPKQLSLTARFPDQIHPNKR